MNSSYNNFDSSLVRLGTILPQFATTCENTITNQFAPTQLALQSNSHLSCKIRLSFYVTSGLSFPPGTVIPWQTNEIHHLDFINIGLLNTAVWHLWVHVQVRNLPRDIHTGLQDQLDTTSANPGQRQSSQMLLYGAVVAVWMNSSNSSLRCARIMLKVYILASYGWHDAF